MPPVKKPVRQLRRHFLREWREHVGLTQERAAERLDVHHTTLGRVENMRIPYSQALLEAAAVAYGCEPWDLLNVNPLVEGEVVDLVRILRDATPEQKAAIAGFAQGKVGAKN